MSQYGDSQDVDMDVGNEDFQEADQESAAISQKCIFFELPPRYEKDFFDVRVFNIFVGIALILS